MIGDWPHDIFDVSLSDTRGDTKILSPVAGGGGGSVCGFVSTCRTTQRNRFVDKNRAPNHLTGHLCPLESGSHTHNNLFTSIY